MVQFLSLSLPPGPPTPQLSTVLIVTVSITLVLVQGSHFHNHLIPTPILLSDQKADECSPHLQSKGQDEYQHEDEINFKLKLTEESNSKSNIVLKDYEQFIYYNSPPFFRCPYCSALPCDFYVTSSSSLPLPNPVDAERPHPSKGRLIAAFQSRYINFPDEYTSHIGEPKLPHPICSNNIQLDVTFLIEFLKNTSRSKKPIGLCKVESEIGTLVVSEWASFPLARMKQGQVTLWYSFNSSTLGISFNHEYRNGDDKNAELNTISQDQNRLFIHLIFRFNSSEGGCYIRIQRYEVNDIVPRNNCDKVKGTAGCEVLHCSEEPELKSKIVKMWRRERSLYYSQFILDNYDKSFHFGKYNGTAYGTRPTSKKGNSYKRPPPSSSWNREVGPFCVFVIIVILIVSVFIACQYWLATPTGILPNSNGHPSPRPEVQTQVVGVPSISRSNNMDIDRRFSATDQGYLPFLTLGLIADEVEDRNTVRSGPDRITVPEYRNTVPDGNENCTGDRPPEYDSLNTDLDLDSDELPSYTQAVRNKSATYK